jgi:hypothetical protein
VAITFAQAVEGSVVVLHPEPPVAVWIVREPTLADKELEHRAQRADRLKDLACIGERVSRTEETALPTDKADDGAPIWRETPTAQTAFAARDQEVLVDAARVEERSAKRARFRFLVLQLRHIGRA